MTRRKRSGIRFTSLLPLGILAAVIAGCRNSSTPPGREAGRDSSAPASPANGIEDGDGDRSAPAGPQTVSIENFTFQPETLAVPAGTKVKWVNVDDVPHTVRSIDDVFRSDTLDTDDVFERVFSEPGTYEYYCGVHRHMTGKIV